VESPAKILDIPKFRDDFYLNNIDWSSRGPLAIALDNEIFLYTPESLIEIGKAPFSSYVSGLKISDCIMAVGLSNGMIDIYDLEKSCLVRTLKNHENRVSAFAFVDDLLVSGSKDRSILVHDLRLFSNQIRSFNDHKGEICTLKTKNSSERIFASGSSDGSAIIWDINHGKIS
jgi:WD40 repeat protein